MGTSVGTITVHDYQLLNDRGRNDDFMAPYRSTSENPCSRQLVATTVNYRSYNIIK